MRIARGIARYPVALLTVVVGLAVLVLALADLSDAGRWAATVYVAGVIAWAGVGMVEDIMRGLGARRARHHGDHRHLGVGEYVAALIVVLMLSGGEALEDYAARRAKQELNALLDRSPQLAHVVVAAGDEIQFLSGTCGPTRSARRRAARAPEPRSCRWTRAAVRRRPRSTTRRLTGESLPVEKRRSATRCTERIRERADLAVEVATARRRQPVPADRRAGRRGGRESGRRSCGSPTGSPSLHAVLARVRRCRYWWLSGTRCASPRCWCSRRRAPC